MSLCITDQETVTFSTFPDIDGGLEVDLETTKPQYVHGRACTLKSVKAISQYQRSIQRI